MAPTTRSLRSNTELDDKPFAPLPSIPKKRKASEIAERIPCFSCADDKLSKQFPDFNPTPDCDHLINTCKKCLRLWIEASVDGTNFKSGGEDGKLWGIQCPQCDCIMRGVNVQDGSTKKIGKRFDDLERQHIGETTPNWRWCLAPGCKEGQVHEPKVPVEEPPKKRKKVGRFWKTTIEVADDNPDLTNICTCHACGAQACATCDRPYHVGETCEAYQLRTKDRQEEEEQALKQIRKLSRPCPGCKKNIQKNGGCPNMNCSQCRCNFCWNCMQKFDQGRFCGCHKRPVGL